MESFEDKRAHFRVDLVRPVKGTAELISINGQQTLLKKNLLLSILDLSAGGMKVETELDLPTKLKIILKVSFELDNEPFDMACELIRKSDIEQKKEYGAKFFELSRRDEQRLVRSLNQYKIRQNKPKSSPAKSTEFKEVELLIKMLEALPGPAFLINTHRVILGSNSMAQNLGVRLGDRCHLTVGKSKKKCSCCRLEEAKSSTIILEEATRIFDTEYSAHWLYLDQGLCLHYFTSKEDRTSLQSEETT